MYNLQINFENRKELLDYIKIMNLIRKIFDEKKKKKVLDKK